MARKNEPYIYRVLRRETPNPRQQAFFRAEAANVAYGGARGGGRRRGLRALVPGARDMIDLEDEKERILEQLAAMVADASVKPELRLKAAGMVLGHERGKAAPAKDEGETEPEVLRFEGALEQWSR